jgi:uncharacterized membrane protein
MTPKTSKYLGGAGAIAMLIGVFPYISWYGIIELIGLILIFAGLYGLAGYYRERSIFSLAIYGVLVAIIGAIVAMALAFIIVLPNITNFLMSIFPAWDGNLSTLPSISSMTPDTSAISFADIIPFITATIVVLIVGWITAIVSTYFFWRSFKMLAVKASVGLFATAGLLLFIGAVLLVLFFFGALLIWIGLLLLAIAFFTMRITQPVMPPQAQTTV